MHKNYANLLTKIIKFEVAGQCTSTMTSAGLVWTEKTSLIDATMRGVSVDTRKRCGIIKLSSLFYSSMYFVVMFVIVYQPLEILFDCCFDLVLEPKEHPPKGKFGIW